MKSIFLIMRDGRVLCSFKTFEYAVHFCDLLNRLIATEGDLNKFYINDVIFNEL